MANTRNPQTDPGQPMIYEIRLKGHLGREWADWFGGLTITLEDNGETLLTGPVLDQVALYGMLEISAGCRTALARGAMACNPARQRRQMAHRK